MLRKILGAIAFAFMGLSAGLAFSGEKAVITEMGATEKLPRIAAEITDMRASLAVNVIKPGAEVTEETFKSVCGAVGRRVKEISEKEGLRIRHAAIKYRNPQNAATEEEATLIRKFEADKDLKGNWDRVEMEGKIYQRYTAPIYVEDACLACHGEKEARPKFITEKYPEDKAYGFKKGDLRGIISVMAQEK